MQHDFKTVDEFRGKALPFFTTHTELVRMQREAVAAKRAQKHGLAKDDDWDGETFVKQVMMSSTILCAPDPLLTAALSPIKLARPLATSWPARIFTESIDELQRSDFMIILHDTR